MQVDQIPPSAKEQAAHKASGLAKSALGWINRVINESVQDLSDFSAMLSAQSEASVPDPKAKIQPGNAGTPQNPENKSVAPEVIDRVLVQCNPGKDSDEIVKKIEKVLVLRMRKETHEDGKSDKSNDTPEEAETILSTEDSEQEIVQDLQVTGELPVPVPAPVPEQEAESAVVVDIAAVQESLETQAESSNTLAAELIVSQMQSPPQTVAPDKEIVKESPESEQFVEPQKAALITLDLAQAKPEKAALNTEREILDLAKNSSSKDLSAALRTQTAPAANNLPEQSAQSATEVQTAISNFNANTPDNTQDPGTFQQNTGNFQAPKIAQPSQLGLAQSFLNTWSSNISQSSISASEERGHSGIEGLAGARLNSLPNKGGIDTAANNPALSTKGPDATLPAADRAFAVAMNNNGMEQGQKSDVLKGFKALTRSQSLSAMEKVEAALQKAAESKDGTLISLRLDPPNLGSVKVDVTFRDGLLHARISADSTQVLQLLREKAPELQVTLRKLGLEVDRVSVSVNSGDSGAFTDDSEGKKSNSQGNSGSFFPELADSAALKEALNLDHWIA